VVDRVSRKALEGGTLFVHGQHVERQNVEMHIVAITYIL
jgi:hypothetical protein